MPVRFYAHSPVESVGERGALFEVARGLLERYGSADAPPFALVANVVPDRVPAWRAYKLTQLDALLLGENFVALLDFKSAARPVIGEENTRWAIVKRDGRHEHDPLLAGHSTNPFHQLKYARHQWSHFFREATKPLLAEGEPSPFDWNELSGRVVFYPWLHHESRLFAPPIWLRFLSAKHVAADAAATTSGFRLTPPLMRALAEDVLQAQVWDLTRYIRSPIFELALVRSDGFSPRSYPIHAHSQVTIGRSSANDIVIDGRYKRSSRYHARLVADDKDVRLYDEGSRHGTFVNKRLVPPAGLRLKAGDRIEFGHGGGDQEGQVATGFIQPSPGSHLQGTSESETRKE